MFRAAASVPIMYLRNKCLPLHRKRHKEVDGNRNDGYEYLTMYMILCIKMEL